jgi:hypothetical protein
VTVYSCASQCLVIKVDKERLETVFGNTETALQQIYSIFSMEEISEVKDKYSIYIYGNKRAVIKIIGENFIEGKTGKIPLSSICMVHLEQCNKRFYNVAFPGDFYELEIVVNEKEKPRVDSVLQKIRLNPDYRIICVPDKSN